MIEQSENSPITEVAGYTVEEILSSLPEELRDKLHDHIRVCTVNYLDEIDSAIGFMDPIFQKIIAANYLIYQFGVLTRVLSDNDLVLADESKRALQELSNDLRTIAGHIELLIAPKERH